MLERELHRRAIMLRLILAASILLLADPGHAAPDASGDAAGSRFIPLQLIIGGEWNGEAAITYPAGTFSESVEHASVWVGPRLWTHPKTGESMTVYDRSRGGRINPAEQIFAVRHDLAAIGRVADSRFGITACDQEAKYPLGLWRQGETRSFEYTCWYGDRPRTQVTTLTIREIDFEQDGRAHCLKVEWVCSAPSRRIGLSTTGSMSLRPAEASSRSGRYGEPRIIVPRAVWSSLHHFLYRYPEESDQIESKS
jgi:hypothetical protein